MIGPFAKHLLFRLDPEDAHGLSIRGLKLYQAAGKSFGNQSSNHPELAVNVAGISFPNPVGMAAGYDKNGEVPLVLLKLGFGFTEIGTVTPRPQEGNPRPRVFRLTSHQAVINRLGFNNKGHSNLDKNLRSIRNSNHTREIIGVNIGANKDSTDFAGDYELGLEKFWDIASYFTINISSPNTPGLRDLQSDNSLSELLKRVDYKKNELQSQTGQSPPVFVKIAPDLSKRAIEGIAKNIRASSVSGLIISNTTISRTELESATHETGGLSGRPLFDRSTIVLAKMRSIIGDEMPIIGVGGIDGVQSVWEKMQAGANLIQLYTGMIYQGPDIAKNICNGLVQRLKNSSYSNISELTSSRTAEWAAKEIPD